MSTFEITLQRKIDLEWPAVSVFFRPGDFLPVRSESRLQLDIQSLLPHANPKDYGIALGKALFRDDLRDALTRAQTQERQDQEPLRILLNVEAEDLKPLHWERLCAPLNGVWDFISLNQGTPFSLHLPSLTDRRYPPIGRRDLRALVLIAGPEELDGDYDLAPFDILTTTASLRQSFGDIPYDILARVEGSAGSPTLEALCERLTAGSYSLLHIVCHGRSNPQGDTILYLPDARRAPITASVFIERLSRLQGIQGLPHFAFLMTCDSASPEAENGFGGLGQRLVRELGMPAVLAMTAPISIRTGSELAGLFYTRLHEHGEVDRAMSEALAGLMGRSDATVPAIFSRLGGRPLFSDALDRPLTSSEIQFGKELLGKLVSERAPILQDEFAGLLSGLHQPIAEVESLSTVARQEYATALENANALSDEIADLSFNALALGRPVPPYDRRCPFRGLASFRPEDRPFFFGREALVGTLLERLEAHPFLAVLGPSGSGKSSLVLAGLVPALAQRIPGCSEQGIFAYLTPGADPLPRLNAALASAPDCALVVVDQFEELFTLCRDEDKRADFIRRLLALSSSHRLVLTMRADFWGECAPYAALKDEMQAHQELVAPLDSTSLRSAIEQQAAAVGLRFEADLAEDILEDVQGEPGAMPLLQHALLLLWERRHGRWLRISEYRWFGGVQQAIAHTADGIYLKLGQAEQVGVRGIFLRLTRLDEDSASGLERRDTRRRVALDELVPAGSERGPTVELVRHLADARLVVTGVNPVDGGEEVEVAHEALIRYWERLRGWLEEDRAALRQGERVREAALQWEESQRGDESLLVHRAGRLDDALELAERKGYAFNQAEIDYLNACQVLRQRERRLQERRRRQWLVAALSAAVIFAFLAGYAFLQSGQATSQAATATYALGIADDQRATAQAASTLAVQQQKTAIFNAEVARINEQEADNQTTRAVRQAQVSLARLLAVQGQELLQSQPNQLSRTVLLSIESLMRYPEGAGVQALADALHLLPRSIARMRHEEQVNSVVFSPDGQWVVSGSGDGTARVWQASSGQEIARMSHEDSVTSVAFSPDGQRAVSGSVDRTVRVWEASSGQEIARMSHEDSVTSVVFSPDGKWVVSGSGDGTARVWEASSGQEIARMSHEDTVYSVAFSPDGQRVVSGSDDHTVRVWEASSGREIARMSHEYAVYSVAFSPDGMWVVSGGQDSTARVWDASNGREISRMFHFNTPIEVNAPIEVALSPDGEKVVSGSVDGTARVWEASSGTEIAQMNHKDFVTSVAFSPDGQQVVTGTTDGVVWVWEASSGQEIARMGHEGRVISIDVSPDGQWVVSGDSDGVIRVWEPSTTGQEITRKYCECVPAIFSPDGRGVVSSDIYTAQVWEASSGEVIASKTHDDFVNVLAISPDGKWVASGDNGGTVWVWEAASGREIARMIHEGPVWTEGFSNRAVNSLAFSPDGQQVVSGSDDGTARVWEASSGREVARMSHEGDVNSVAFSPDGQWVVSGSEDGAARVWEASSGQEIARMSYEGSVTSIAFSPNGELVLIKGGDVVSVWELSSGQEITRMSDIRSFALSPDGKWVASSSWNDALWIWTASSGEEIIRMSGNKVTSVAFSPDGKWLVSGSFDGTARVWEASSGQEIARMSHEDTVYSVAFSPDGKWVLSYSGFLTTTVRVWLWRPQDLISLACSRLDRNLTREEWAQYIPGEAYRRTCPELP